MEQTNKNDKRWWHVEERVSGKKSLIIGRKIQTNWYYCEETAFSCKCFNSVDMLYFHLVLIHRVFEFQYFHRL